MKKYNVFRGVCTIFFIGSFILGLSAQKDRRELESQRKALENQIRSTTEILEKTQKNKTRSLQQLKALNEKIRQRQELLASINEEIKEVDYQATLTERKKTAAEQHIQDLEARFAFALRAAYFRTKLQPDWIYLLSASSLSQMMVRWVYLRQYKNYVLRQLKTLADQKAKYNEAIRTLEETREAKTTLLKTEEKNKNVIQTEQKSKEALVRDLGKEEKKLKSQLASSQEKKKKLDAEIARLISAETSKVTSSGLKEAPETKALNDQFSANKGKLPWPVGKGLITDRFGTHPHPVLKGITVQNNGVDIQAEPGTSVRSLFNGTVASVQKIPGYDFMVMVRHGLYFSVYSKLQTVNVKKGDTVTTGQVLGNLSNDEPELHLEIWQDKTKLNPETWMARR
jgi:septal ring factor EnvC (AmiA/AmiB activator)